MHSASGQQQQMMQVSKSFAAEVILFAEATRDFTVFPGTAALIRAY